MYVCITLFLLVHIVCVAPGIRPSNSYGMMLDGFPVKDFLDKKYIAYLLLCIPIELLYGSAHIFLGFSAFSFVFFAYIGGWLPYYCRELLVLALVFVGAIALTNAPISIGLILLQILLLHRLNNHYAQDHRINARYDHWIRHSIATYTKKFGNSMPANEPHHSVILTLMFIEDRSRPRLTRWVEYAKGTVQQKRHSYGIMQVQSDHKLSDTESVIAAKKLIAIYLKGKTATLTDKEIKKLAKQWNGNVDYAILFGYVYGVALSTKDK
jgi:hypothetical protein